jgi:hypothetical protein
MYKQLKNELGNILPMVLKTDTNTYVPFDESNGDYVTYLKWLDGYTRVSGQGWVKTSDSNTPEPADSE